MQTNKQTNKHRSLSQFRTQSLSISNQPHNNQLQINNQLIAINDHQLTFNCEWLSKIATKFNCKFRSIQTGRHIRQMARSTS